MYKATVLVVLCLAVTGYAGLVPRIAGGRPAPDGKYPYQVSLRYAGRHDCGGSIINERYILTATHCFFSRDPRDYKNFRVVAGTNSLSKGGTFYEIEEVIMHEDYDKWMITNDIALLKLKTDIEFNAKVQPIRLATSELQGSGQNAVLTGWGVTGVTEPTPDWLQEIDLKILDRQKCYQTWSNVFDSNVCTLTKAGEGACTGDSGGPLVVDGVQVGVVSFGSPCARGAPDVYANVAYYDSWIQSKIEKHD